MLDGACRFFERCGFSPYARFVDFVADASLTVDRREAELVSPATVDELLAAGALDASLSLAWERSVASIEGRKREIEGLAIASDERVEALVLFRSVADGNEILRLSARRAEPLAALVGALKASKARCDRGPQGLSRGDRLCHPGGTGLSTSERVHRVGGGPRRLTLHEGLFRHRRRRRLERQARWSPSARASPRASAASATWSPSAPARAASARARSPCSSRSRFAPTGPTWRFSTPTSTARARRAWRGSAPRRCFPARTVSSCRARRPASAWSRWGARSGVAGARLRQRRARRHLRVARDARIRAARRPARRGRLGALDYLLVDLPPGAERITQYAEYLGAETAFVLVTIPSDLSRGVVSRSIAALAKTPNRILGYVENMNGYYCRDCGSVRPLFAESNASISESRASAPCRSIPSSPPLAIAASRCPPATVARRGGPSPTWRGAFAKLGGVHEVSLRAVRSADEARRDGAARPRRACRSSTSVRSARTASRC